MVSSQDALERQFGTINAETLGVIDQVGRGVEPGAVPVRQAKSLQSGANAAFAVGSGHVEAAQTSLGIAHFFQQTLHPVQFQLDVAGILLIDMVQKFLISQSYSSVLEMWKKLPATGASTSAAGKGQCQFRFIPFLFRAELLPR